MMRPTGMRAFLIVWAGQLVSLLGTAMTQFALTIWAYQLTQSATALALVAFSGSRRASSSARLPGRWSTAGIASW
ncbi:MAG: hypothetical protein U0521_23365 [Anaerolineae bacterium]